MEAVDRKRGETRQDGLVFWGYRKRKGRIYERWHRPEAAENQRKFTHQYNLLTGLKKSLERMNSDMTILPASAANEFASKLPNVTPISMAYIGSNTVFFGQYQNGTKFAAITHRNGCGGQVVVSLENLQQMVTILQG